MQTIDPDSLVAGRFVERGTSQARSGCAPFPMALGNVGGDSVVIAFRRVGGERPRDASAFASSAAKVTHERQRLECLQVRGREVHVVHAGRGMQTDARTRTPGLR